MRSTLTLLLLTMLHTPLLASAQYTAGVSQNQWARYDISGDPSLTEEFTSSELNVTSVAGANVTIASTDKYGNGTSPGPETFWIDVATGQSNLPAGERGFYFAISAGIKVGDPIYPGWSNLTIQGRETRTYAQGTRSVSLLSFAQAFPQETRSTRYRWDWTTGIITEIIVTISTGETLHVNMTATDMWSPDLPTSHGPQDFTVLYFVALGLAGTVVLAMILYGPRRSKRQRS